MRFSIRSLLAIMLLCGIVFPLLLGLSQVRREEAMRAQLHNEIQLLRERLALDDPKRKLVKQRQREEYESLRALRDTAEQHFTSIQEKYGKIEARGSDTVSLRTIPQLSLHGGIEPTVFRLRVPADRDVWLKYAVVTRKVKDYVSDELDQLDQPPTNTGFQHNGLYEVRLSPGERILEVHTEPVTGHDLPIAIRLDDAALLNTRFSGDGVPTNGSYHISGRKQIDFDAKRELPWLLNVNIRVERDDGTREYVPDVACLWLSDRSSNFDRFPGSEKDQ